MKILTLDLSLTSTGFAIFEYDVINGIPVFDKNNLIECGKINPKCNNEERLLYIYNTIENLIALHDIDIIIIEDGFVGNNRKVGIQLSELRGCIKLLAMQWGIEIISAPPQAVKKVVCEGSSLSKEEVAHKLKSKYEGNQIFDSIGDFSDKANKNKTSDIYDAIALYEYYKSII